jgi:1-acyl-sn-glycerol-3-phosphate acyltransferase
MSNNSQFALLKTRRFLPFFITQAGGALNDNIFKNALAVLIAFQGSQLAGLNSDQLINLSAGLFILPFFLFSAMVGQFADKYERSRQIRFIKLLEVLIMLMAALGFWLQSMPVLLLVLFLLGLQSTLFSPIKYSLLPQVLEVEELVAGNGLVEAGTFVAILFGTALGAYFIAMPHYGTSIITLLCLIVAALGYLSSRFIPTLPASESGLIINWNPVSESWRILKSLASNRTLLNSVLGLSWFWFFGAIILVQIPSYTINVLGGAAEITAGLLLTFIIGISTGSLLCHKLSGDEIEIGLVPLGSIGMTLFAVDMEFASHVIPLGDGVLLGQFLSTASVWRILFDMVMLGVFGGFFTVPLFAIVQHRSPPERRARVMAANSILNAAFMVLASIMAIWLLGRGYHIPDLFLLTGILNAVIAIYIYLLVPEFFLRFLAWLGTRSMYQLQVDGRKNLPAEGPGLLICNHISYMDAPILAGAIRRPLRFVMHHRIWRQPLLNWLFRSTGAIPIAPGEKNPVVLQQALERIDHRLQQGELVMIFPEGRLTRDGSLQRFRHGIEEILARNPVPVIPAALHGLWGSRFSMSGTAPALNRERRGLLREVRLRFGQPLSADGQTAASLQQAVAELYQQLDALSRS